MDWRKFDLVEYRKGRYRLERQTWSFWDWCLLVIIVSVVWRFWWFFLAVGAAIGLAVIIPTVVAGIALAIVSLRK